MKKSIIIAIIITALLSVTYVITYALSISDIELMENQKVDIIISQIQTNNANEISQANDAAIQEMSTYIDEVISDFQTKLEQYSTTSKNAQITNIQNRLQEYRDMVESKRPTALQHGYDAIDQANNSAGSQALDGLNTALENVIKNKLSN